jgi:hypothetical protein
MAQPVVIANSTGDTITVTPGSDTQTGVIIVTIREYRARRVSTIVLSGTGAAMLAEAVTR